MDYPEEWNDLPKRERKKKLKDLKKEQSKKPDYISKYRNWGIGVAIVAVIFFGGYYWWNNVEILPPTSSIGHTEASPAEHIIDTQMGSPVQRHMIEHSDGNGLPGVIINYNCVDFSCDDGLIDELAKIASEYPEFVYLAPFPGMTVKIAITKEGSIETFDSLDKEALTNFIK